MVEAYDSSVHEAPFLINHDLGSPNFGLIKSVFRVGKRLFALPKQMASDFVEAVNSGRWPKLSAGLYAPDDPANPRPGHWGLREVSAVQIPGVKGQLSPKFEFSGESAVDWPCIDFVFFSEGESMAVETAQQEPEAGTPASPPVDYTEQIKLERQATQQAEEQRRLAAIALKEQDLNRRLREIEFREAANERATADRTFVQARVAEGKLVGPQVEMAFSMLQNAKLEGVAFAEDDKNFTQHGLIKKFLQSLQPQVSYAEFAGAAEAPAARSGQSQSQQIQQAAMTYMHQQAQAGHTVGLADAISHVAEVMGIERQ